MNAECPYCEKPLPDERAACCGEVGHGVPQSSSAGAPGDALAIAAELEAEASAEDHRGVGGLCRRAAALLRSLASPGEPSGDVRYSVGDLVDIHTPGPLVPRTGWKIDRLPQTGLFTLWHPNGSTVMLPRHEFSLTKEASREV